MSCSSEDARFAVQQVPNERWRQATAANLAADHLNGYDLWTMAFLEGRQDWEETRDFLLSASRDELTELVEKSRGESLAFLVMMMTGACNADCPICFTDRRRKRGETTVEQRDRLLREAAGLGAGYVYVPGEGEPTIDRGWWQFLETCKDTGLEAIVFTNGLIFSDTATSEKYWGCQPEEAIERLADYPVSFYVKMWSTQPELVGKMLGINPDKYQFTDYDGVRVPLGMARLLDRFPRQRLGIEVVVEGRNADEVVDTVVPFAERHDLSRIVEIIQHNGRTLGNPTYDPTPAQVARATPLLSPTSCTVATCKAVVTSRGYLSPRIAILETQLPASARHIDEGSLWDLLHGTDYLVQRRYEQSCLCESEPVSLAEAGTPTLIGPQSVVPPQLADLIDPMRPTATATANDFTSTSTVADLLGGRVEHGSVVRVVGRALPVGPGLVQLADGPDTVSASGVDVGAYSWVGVEGTWDGLLGALRATDTTIIKESMRQPIGRAVSEFAMVRQPEMLRTVIDRSALTSLLRNRLAERGYLEVSTPMLTVNGDMGHVSQAQTEPVLGRRFHLRTDPEEYLKRYLTAGLPAVFEVSTNVRADKPGDWHLVEFQSVEYYRRLMTLDESIEVADDLVREGLRGFGPPITSWSGVILHPERPFNRMRYADAFQSVLGVDLSAEECATAKGLAATLRTAGCEIEVPEELVGWRRAWLEAAFDGHVLPKIRQPLWITHFPAELAVQARLDQADPRYALRAELYLPGGLELANVYENLVDGAELRAQYNTRRSHRVAAGMSYVATNEALMTSAEAGMPPMSGGAIGIDRVLMVALGHASAGGGVLFGREGFTELKSEHSVCGSDGGCGSCGGGCR
ncbi:amino acid--tRNA ligase-related protein [Polymorphospora rubra]|uniref:amino acid--tRNA ligase-related protein n=1 Tax=Polymorphospora rubra TaxID=338584 RepID=UPI0033EAA8B7